MSQSPFAELSLEHYGQLVLQSAGDGASISFCDSEGEVLWDSLGRTSEALAEAIDWLHDRDGGAPGAALKREELGGGGSLLYARIGAHADHAERHLLVIAQSSGSRRTSELEAALEHAVACIRRQSELAYEVGNLAGELSTRYEELNLIYSLETPATQIDQGTAGFEVLLGMLASHLDCDIAALATSTRRRPIYTTNLSQPIPNLDLVLTEIRGNLFRFVSMSRQPLVLNSRDEAQRQFLFTHLPYKVLACPIPSPRFGEAVIVLLRHADRPDFENSDRSLASVVSTQTGIMLRNQQMLQKMQRFGEQMAAALIEAIEAKDPYTRGHSERVQAVAVQIGEVLELRQPQIEGIAWGSILHDVGKIGIPDAILAKPCRLTPDEYTFVKIHPERSYEIMRHIDYLSQDALDGARYHQERYDGKGYPHGLAGREIPFTARVIAVADTYDAICSSRAYRAASSHEDALAEILKVSGSQLDPDVVRAFERLCSRDASWLIELSKQRESRYE